MKSLIKKIFNPFELFRAYKFHKKHKKYAKSENDLELLLYSKIISTDMLHYGYFEDPDINPNSISLKDLENAQIKYVDLITEQIKSSKKLILDVGAGMGGLCKILNDRNYNVQALTPDNNQKKYITNKYPDIILHHTKFENFKTDEKYGTIINSESLQYINLESAFNIIDNILDDNGLWIVTDYFRYDNNGINKSGHLFSDFKEKAKKYNWEIIHENDITKNAVPTLNYAINFIERFVKPFATFAKNKLKYKYPWIYYLTKHFQENINTKSDIQLASLDPQKFINEKKYLFLVLQKTSTKKIK